MPYESYRTTEYNGIHNALALKFIRLNKALKKTAESYFSQHIVFEYRQKEKF